MNNERRKRISEVHEQLSDLRDQIEELQGEEQDYYDNMPESFQNGSKGEAAQEAADSLQTALSLQWALDSVSESLGYLEDSLS